MTVGVTGSEPAGGATATERPMPGASTIRWRWFAACLGLVALAFTQDPGRIAADTKLDLIANPGGLLSRAGVLWEPLAFFGQLQNQGYGYLFPMGPFFWIGNILGTPEWVIQRLWWSLLLVVAFLGIVRLTRLLGITGFWPRLAGGLAYALAPRMVTELGVLSVEVLPFAVAPWVLIPLVRAAEGGSPRRWSAWSGVAIACAGGVNAVASAAVLPLGAWWILTRFRGRRLASMLGWWSLAVVAATLWWAIPLLVLGQYSPPFLDWIESASVTTSITAPDTIVRGTSQWVAYISDSGGPVWPSGWALVTSSGLILATGVVAALGAFGLSLRATPHRLFLVGILLIGVIAVGFGHVGQIPGLGADLARSLLDGALAPLRNTHKFDLLIRLPMAIGVAAAVAWLMSRINSAARDDQRWRRWWGVAAVGVIGLSLIAGAQPALAGMLTRDRSFTDIPVYWSDAASWLADQEQTGRALLLPSASFGIYTWGRTNDEPLQPLATTPWVVRDAVPLSGAGAIRWLDGVNERLTTGRGAPGLSAAMARAGVSWIVIRNDLDRRRADSSRSELIRQGLLRSGGFVPVASFGPVLPPYRTETTVVDGGLGDTTAAVEIWRVVSGEGGGDPRVALRPADEVLVMSGAAEGMLDLADVGALDPGRPVVMAGDEQPLVDQGDVTLSGGITDSFPRSEVNFGRSWQNRSGILSDEEAFQADRRVHDYEPIDPDGRQFRVFYEGGTVTASSSAADADALFVRGIGGGPFASVDADPFTAWMSSGVEPALGQWWEVKWNEVRDFSGEPLAVRFVADEQRRAAPAAVEVTTDAGTVTTRVEATEDEQFLAVSEGPTSFLRVTLTAQEADSRGSVFGIRDIDIPDPPSRIYETAGEALGGPLVFTAQRGDSAGCLTVGGVFGCSDSLIAYGAERTGITRQFVVAQGGEYRVGVRVRPRVGAALDAMLTANDPAAITAVATSQRVPDPAVRPQAAVDGSLETSWMAQVGDTRPELRLSWAAAREVRGVRLGINSAVASSRPLTVTLIANGITTTSVIDEDGIVRMPTTVTRALTIRFDNASTVRSLDPLTGTLTPLPIAVSEVTVLGASDLVKGPAPAAVLSLPCGDGPSVVVDGETLLTTEVSWTPGEALTDSLVTARPCGGRVIDLPAGTHRLQVASSPEFTVESVLLEPVAPVGSSATVDTPEVLRWGSAERAVEVAPAPVPRLLEVTENFNPGWTAELDGVALTPLRVDGWRQAWVIPPGQGGQVDMAFAPNGAYRLGLGIGALGLLGLLVLLVWPTRRRYGPQPMTEGRVGPALLAAMGLIASVLLAGLPGLAVGAVGIGALLWGARRHGLQQVRVVESRAILAGASIQVAGVLAAMMPWPERLDAPGWMIGLAALFTVLGLAATAGPNPRVVQRADESNAG